MRTGSKQRMEMDMKDCQVLGPSSGVRSDPHCRENRARERWRKAVEGKDDDRDW